MTKTTPSDDRLKLAYVVRRFPKLSETFVVSELLALEAQGVRTELYALNHTQDQHYHADVARLAGPIYHVPGKADLAKIEEANQRSHAKFAAAYEACRAAALAGQTGEDVTPLSYPQLWSFLQAGYVAARLRKTKPDHIHAHFATDATTIAMHAAAITGIPFSFTAHAYDIFKHEVESATLRAKIAASQFVITVSRKNKDFLCRLAPEAEEKIHIVHNGIALDRFMPKPAAECTTPTILSVARLVEKKGIRFLVEACQMMKAAGTPFRCVVIGQGNERKALADQIAAAGLTNEVELLGAMKQTDVLDWYAKADVFVLPSIVGSDGNMEGLPVSIVEALASGLPVVTTDVGGIPEVVSDGVNGFVVPEQDPGALADRLSRLCADVSLRQQMSQAARPSVNEAFDQTHTAARLIKIFKGYST